MIQALGITALLLAPVGVQETAPDAETLIQQAWTFLPAYDFTPRPLLDDSSRARATAGAHLLRAALALSPEHVRGLWSLGYAESLLAEDRHTRGDRERATQHKREAEEALQRAMLLRPEDPWALYARGAVRGALGEHRRALGDLKRTRELCDQLRARGDSSVDYLRFKTLEQNAELLQRAGEFVQARAALESFHEEFSNNDWPLLIALAESHLRERSFPGAFDAYRRAIEGYPSDHQAYALSGYLAGLVGDREEATRQLTTALEHELAPGMYTRLWLWILATEDAREGAREDLAGFLANPPSTLSAWDRTLGSFVLGSGEATEFLAAGRAEHARRLEAAEPLDDLLCEVWYYAGLRHELDAAELEADAREGRLRQALHAYGTALESSPARWKWEWAFARLAFARLAAELDLPADPGFRIDGASYQSPHVQGTLARTSWHRPGTLESVPYVADPQPGDLLVATVTTEGGVEVRVIELVDWGE